MSNPLPGIADVRALPGHMLAVRWRDSREDVVDFGAVLASHPAFAPLLDEAAFARVYVVDWGGGIEWESGADYAADALHALAVQQRGSTAGFAPQTLEGLLEDYDAVGIRTAMGSWLDGTPKGREIS